MHCNIHISHESNLKSACRYSYLLSSRSGRHSKEHSSSKEAASGYGFLCMPSSCQLCSFSNPLRFGKWGLNKSCWLYQERHRMVEWFKKIRGCQLVQRFRPHSFPLQSHFPAASLVTAPAQLSRDISGKCILNYRRHTYPILWCMFRSFLMYYLTLPGKMCHRGLKLYVTWLKCYDRLRDYLIARHT